MTAPLRRAAAEAAELYVMSETLQTVVGRLVAELGAPTARLMEDGQAADLLAQRLAGLAAFLAAVADGTDPAAAAAGLTLADQKRRLAGSGGGRIEADAGDLVLFED